MVKLAPCPFCAAELEESAVFSNRTAKHFMHPPSDDPCIASSINIIVSDREDDQQRVAAWNRRTLPADVTELVVAAREFWEVNEDMSLKSCALDKALEAFAERVPYENEPEDTITANGGDHA
ncbi:Lar family restriction alleviation protein [Shinella zoogloeoides]|uniref:Lar family restriction alleviation protein n=1 Tax=Shinella zoogloeoides TaxID=352475 RepID=UPI001F5A8993|nr:Lar family restriction alleviation protein [Shinella zoogloeoides]